MNPGYVVLALIIAAFLAWSWGRAREVVEDDAEAAELGKAPTFWAWLLVLGGIALEGAIFLGLALLTG